MKKVFEPGLEKKCKTHINGEDSITGELINGD